MAPFEMRARPDGPARIPDILFVAREHRDRIESLRLNGPADLIVELISPESVRRDRVEKLHEYAAAGVLEYWLIDTRPSPAPPVCYRLNSAG
jgi:Uma2 family endonuclease